MTAERWALVPLECLQLGFALPTVIAVMLPPEVEQTEDHDGGEGTEAVRHNEIHWRPPSVTRLDRPRHRPAAQGCAPRRQSGAASMRRLD
jgi:hypothetical protein